MILHYLLIKYDDSSNLSSYLHIFTFMMKGKKKENENYIRTYVGNQGRIHKNIRCVLWAGAVTEIRSHLGK